MKLSLSLLCAVLAGFISITQFSSCKSDPCMAINCANGGTCDGNGTCVCPSGYEGTQCDAVTRDKFLDVYSVSEKGTRSNYVIYSLSIQKGVKLSDVVIRNFYNQAIDSVAAYVHADTLYIPQQVVDGRWDVAGYGKLYPDKYYGYKGRLEVHYRVRDLNLPPNTPPDDFGYSQGDFSRWVR